MTSVWHENGHSVPLEDGELRQIAWGMLHARRAMRGTLPAALIHDVALEALLTIYLAHGRSTFVEQLVNAAEVPGNTTRRWLAALASEDLIVVDDHDASLTAYGFERTNQMLTSVVRSQRGLLGWAQH